MRTAESLFRRYPTVEIVTEDGEIFARRGTVRPEKTGAPPFGVETFSAYGALTAPLYRYEGDAAELLGEKGRNASLFANGERYRVLFVRRETGPGGTSWVRAVLEKEAGE